MLETLRSSLPPLHDPLRSPAQEPTTAPHPLSNRLLSALSASELAQLRPLLVPVQLRQRETLFEADAPISHVYFPETAVVSMVSRLRDGGMVEVGTAGREGMVGLSLFLAHDTSSVHAFTQIGGLIWRMDAASFAQHVDARSALHRVLLRYTQAFLTQVSQTAACNAAHLVGQRCARWLLMTHDRVESDTFALTHDFLALMLGVRRAGVTVAMRALQDAGLVDYARGEVRIVDRTGLGHASCECYDVMRVHFEALVPQDLNAWAPDRAGSRGQEIS